MKRFCVPSLLALLLLALAACGTGQVAQSPAKPPATAAQPSRTPPRACSASCWNSSAIPDLRLLPKHLPDRRDMAWRIVRRSRLRRSTTLVIRPAEHFTS